MHEKETSFLRMCCRSEVLLDFSKCLSSATLHHPDVWLHPLPLLSPIIRGVDLPNQKGTIKKPECTRSPLSIKQRATLKAFQWFAESSC